MSSYTVSHQVGARCSRLVCGRVFAGLPRLMWHGGHFCQIDHLSFLLELQGIMGLGACSIKPLKEGYLPKFTRTKAPGGMSTITVKVVFTCTSLFIYEVVYFHLRA